MHDGYLAAGDIISTNMFNATATVQEDFGTQDVCFEINRQAAAIARQCADATLPGTTPNSLPAALVRQTARLAFTRR